MIIYIKLLNVLKDGLAILKQDNANLQNQERVIPKPIVKLPVKKLNTLNVTLVTQLVLLVPILTHQVVKNLIKKPIVPKDVPHHPNFTNATPCLALALLALNLTVPMIKIVQVLTATLKVLDLGLVTVLLAVKKINVLLIVV